MTEEQERHRTFDDDITLGEVNRNLNRLSELVERRLSDVEMKMVPREIYELDRGNIARRLQLIESDIVTGVKARETEVTDSRQRRMAAMAASVPLLAAIITVLAGGHL